LKIRNTQDIEDARQTVEKVLKVRSSVSLDEGKITAPMADADLVTDLLISLREAGIHLAELSVQKPTLDEVFLTITGNGLKEGALISESDEVGEVRV
jgi:ABC-2 type transport system ATP-binding protein